MFATNTEYGPAKGFKVVMKRKFKVDKKNPKSISRRQRSQTCKFSKGDQAQLLNPLTDSKDFGFLRCPQNRDYLPIHLFLGFHNAAANGFGLKHIWHGHSGHLIAHDCLEMCQVGNFLGVMFQSAPQVFCEGNFQEIGRVTVVHKQYGTVVLEVRRKYGRPCWSIITAHEGTATGGKFFGSVKAALQN
jgi:hypothetical protein